MELVERDRVWRGIERVWRGIERYMEDGYVWA